MRVRNGGGGGDLVAGVDCSTQATKVVVVDAATGGVAATGRADHVVTGSRGASESDPRQWWDALCRAIAMTGRARDIRALSIAGQQHGLVALGTTGAPLRPAMLWNDTRSAPDTAALVDALGAEAWAERTGSRPVASFTVTKWAWLRRNEPSVVSEVAAVRLPHDYLTGQLTGAGVTDRGDASGTGWWSSAAERYDEVILGLPAVDLDPALLPRVLGPGEPAGPVRSSVAGQVGLRPGTLVGPGTGDNMGAALALGLDVGQPVISLGTSGTVFTTSEQRPVDPSGVVAGFADATGRFLPLACTLNCTLAVDRVASWLGLDRDAVVPSGDVVVLPFFDGERTPDLPDATAVITGLRGATEPGQILMAAYEGAVASLVEALDAVAAQARGGAGGVPGVDPVGGVDDTPIVLLGGGAAGQAWRDVVARLSGRPLLIPAARELTAFGAAVQAAAVAGGEDPGVVAARWSTDAVARIAPVPRDEERLEHIRSAVDRAYG